MSQMNKFMLGVVLLCAATPVFADKNPGNPKPVFASPYFFGSNQPNGEVFAIAVDPSNNKVYVGGHFTRIGNLTVNNIAVLDGSTWHALNTGVDGTVYAIDVVTASVNNTTGVSDVYIGGSFNVNANRQMKNICFWNEKNGYFTGLGNTDGPVYAIAHYSPGGPDMVFVGGSFSTILGGAKPVSNMATVKDEYPYGLEPGPGVTGGAIRALAITTTPGTQPVKTVLYAGGDFTRPAGPFQPNSIVYGNFAQIELTLGVAAGWWSPFNTNGAVLAIKQVGNDLYVGGKFDGHIGKWDGARWSKLSMGTNGDVRCIDGTKDMIIAGGQFSKATGGSNSVITVTSLNVAAWVTKHTVTHNGSRLTSTTTTSWVGLQTGFTGSSGINAVYVKSNADGDILAGGAGNPNNLGVYQPANNNWIFDF